MESNTSLSDLHSNSTNSFSSTTTKYLAANHLANAEIKREAEHTIAEATQTSKLRRHPGRICRWGSKPTAKEKEAVRGIREDEEDAEGGQ
jgi:hypothetical protein